MCHVKAQIYVVIVRFRWIFSEKNCRKIVFEDGYVSYDILEAVSQEYVTNELWYEFDHFKLDVAVDQIQGMHKIWFPKDEK